MAYTGTATIGGPGTSVTLNYGTPATGNWLLALFVATESPNIVEGLPSGEGWQVLLDNGSGTEISGVTRKFVLVGKQWGVGHTDDSTPTFTWGGTAGIVYGVQISSGGAIASPVADATQGGAAVCPSVSVASDSSQAVFFAVNCFAAAIPTAPTQGSQNGQLDADGTNFRFATSVVDKNSGTTGTCDWTGDGIESLRITLVIPPAAAAADDVPPNELNPSWLYEPLFSPDSELQWPNEDAPPEEPLHSNIFDAWLYEALVAPEDFWWGQQEEPPEFAVAAPELQEAWLFGPAVAPEDWGWWQPEELGEEAVPAPELGELPEWLAAELTPEGFQWAQAEDLPEDALYSELGPDFLNEAQVAPEDHAWWFFYDPTEDALYGELGPDFAFEPPPVPTDHQWTQPVDLPEDALYRELGQDWLWIAPPPPQDAFAWPLPENVITIIPIEEPGVRFRFSQDSVTFRYNGATATFGFAQQQTTFRRPRKTF